MPLALLGRAVGRGRRRALLALLAGAAAWGAGEAVLLLSSLGWDRLALLHFLWSAAGGAACAGATRAAAARGWLAPERVEAAPRAAAHGLSLGPIAGCGVLFYLVALTEVALVSILARTVDPSARRMISPLVLLWASPGLPLGMVLGALWQRRLGAVSVEAVARFFVGIHLVLLGTAALVGLDMWATLALNPPHLRLHPHQMTAGFAALAFVLVPLVAYGYFVSLAPRRRAVFARAAACLGLFLASLVQVEMAAGTVALLHRQRALRDDRADDGPTARRAVGDWEHYLATFPESDERAEVLWRVATTLVRLGEHGHAHDAFASLASLPADVPGQRWTRQARAILAHFTDTPGGARSDAATAPLIEHADYLSNDWRSVLSFLGTGEEVAREEFLGRLRLISLDRDKIVLPPVTSLFAVKAYGRLLGVEVAVRPVTLDEVKAHLAAGRPVLVQRQDRWLCLVGVDARWGTLLYYDYERETERLRQAHRQAEARALFEEGGAGSRARLGALRSNLLEDIPADDVAQALADRHGLAATIGPPAGDGSGAWDEFLLGELAYQASDPVAALDHYATAASGLGGPSWPLLYLHLAARASAEPAREIVKRRLLPAANADALVEWQRQAGHAALLARARAEFEGHDLATLPTPLLERLGALLRRDPAADPSLLARCYETLRARYPEHGPYLTALAEVYRRSGALAPLATVERDQANLEPANADHLLDLAETLLGLDRPDDTRAALRRVREQGAWWSPRYLALAGRAALARGEHRSAVGLLRRALDANHADPELRAELALALEGIGEREQALEEWRWVELAAVDPRHRELARERLAGQERGR